MTSSDSLFFAFQQTLAGRYSIERELGRGGMGIVYLAHEVRLDRMVAIKLLPPEKAADDALREGFLREVRLAAKLTHPNIIPIHAVEESDGFVFYVMAFVDGETLASRIRARGPLSSAEGARVLREVAWGLSHAHGHGFVHRDVKPDNILIEASTGRVLVADFGIAAAIGVTAEGSSGTPEFMSPEQVLGEQVDARSDLYALGATAFYAFSGRFPFEGKTATEVLAKQVTEPAPPLASLGLPVSRKLAALVDRCLSKDPQQRPESSKALAEQLTLALEQRRDVPAALRAFVKRHARLNGAGTMVVALGLIPVSVAVGLTMGRLGGLGAFVTAAGVLPFGYCTSIARRLLLQGFAHQDLAPAFKTEIEQMNEELSTERSSRLNMLGRFSRSVMLLIERSLLVATKVIALIWLGSTLAVVAFPGSAAFASGETVSAVMGLSGMFTLLSVISYISVASRTHDVETAFWSKFWTGRIGKAAFWLARRLLGSNAREPAMTHRATELSLGLAAEQLYESLPKQLRQSLPDLLPLLGRLQDDAQILRKQAESAQELLADASDPLAPAYADVREISESAHLKLSEAVGALEMIRLNLLRLHAGSATVESVTTHLNLAAEVSEDVERLIAAHREAERVISYPRLATPTPV